MSETEDDSTMPAASTLRLHARAMANVVSPEERCVRLSAEITSLRAQLDEARRKVIEECAKVAEGYRDNAYEVGAYPQSNAFEMLIKEIRALLTESTT